MGCHQQKRELARNWLQHVYSCLCCHPFCVDCWVGDWATPPILQCKDVMRDIFGCEFVFVASIQCMDSSLLH